MTWIKVDDKTPRHPKISPLSDRAFRAWFAALCYASEFLTDGLLPVAFLLSVRRGIQEEVISSGLWRVDASGEVWIHDYLDHQRDKASVRKQRDGGRDRQRKFRNAQRNAVTNNEVTRLEESRADQPPNPLSGGSRRKAKTKLRAVEVARDPLAVEQAMETQRRRAVMVAEGKTDDEIAAIFDAEYDARKAASA